MNLKYSIRITDPAREILHEQLKNDPDFNLVIDLDYDIIAKKFMIYIFQFRGKCSNVTIRS